MEEEKEEKKLQEKKYYKTKYHPQYNLSAANIRLYNQILNLKVNSIFEFGCNVGRHLIRLQSMGYIVAGMDINKDFVRSAILSDIEAEVGDEDSLKEYIGKQFDLSFTNSVLCHMPPDSTKKAIIQLKRITKKHIIALECVSKSNNFWWIHDYEKYGFKKVLEVSSHRVEDATYVLYRCDL
jgi:SAM-dependent methyltransferase